MILRLKVGFEEVSTAIGLIFFFKFSAVRKRLLSYTEYHASNDETKPWRFSCFFFLARLVLPDSLRKERRYRRLQLLLVSGIFGVLAMYNTKENFGSWGTMVLVASVAPRFVPGQRYSSYPSAFYAYYVLTTKMLFSSVGTLTVIINYTSSKCL